MQLLLRLRNLQAHTVWRCCIQARPSTQISTEVLPACAAFQRGSDSPSALEGAGDGHTIFVYARSAVTGVESVMQIPVMIGEKPKETGPGSG